MPIKNIRDIGGDRGGLSGPQGIPVKVDLGTLNSSISSQNSVSNTFSSMINREASAVQNAVNKVSNTVNNSIYPGVGSTTASVAGNTFSANVSSNLATAAANNAVGSTTASVAGNAFGANVSSNLATAAANNAAGSTTTSVAGMGVAEAANTSIVQNAGNTFSANVTGNLANTVASNAVGSTTASVAGTNVANDITAGLASESLSQGIDQAASAVGSGSIGAAGIEVAETANTTINQTVNDSITTGAVGSVTANAMTEGVIENAGNEAITNAVNGSVQGVARAVGSAPAEIIKSVDNVLGNPGVSNGMYAVGFNPEQATTLMNQLISSYNDTIISIKRYFEGLFNTLVQNWKAPEARVYYTTVFIPSCTSAFQSINSFYTNLSGRVNQAISLWIKTTNSTLNINSSLTLVPVPNFEDKIPSNLETGNVSINNNLKDMVKNYNAIASLVYKTVMKDAYDKISTRTAFLGADQQQNFVYEMSKMNTNINETIDSVVNAALLKVTETIQKYQQVAQSIANSFSNAIGGTMGIQ